MTFPWGEVKSNEAAVTESCMELEIEPMNDTAIDQIMTAANGFVDGWVASFNALDSSRRLN